MPVFVYTNVTASSKSEYVLSSFNTRSRVRNRFSGRIYCATLSYGDRNRKALDPVADKLFQLAIAVCLVVRVPGMWVILIIFLIKETVLTLCSTYYLFRYHRKMDGAKWFGKVSTAVFYTMTFLMVLLPPLPVQVYYVMEVLMGITLMISFIMYNQFFIDLHRELKKNNELK